jgi:hypothetical protein
MGRSGTTVNKKSGHQGRRNEKGWKSQTANTKPLSVRLSPSEFKMLAEHASKNMRSLSGQALCFIRDALGIYEGD